MSATRRAEAGGQRRRLAEVPPQAEPRTWGDASRLADPVARAIVGAVVDEDDLVRAPAAAELEVERLGQGQHGRLLVEERDDDGEVERGCLRVRCGRQAHDPARRRDGRAGPQLAPLAGPVVGQCMSPAPGLNVLSLEVPLTVVKRPHRPRIVIGHTRASEPRAWSQP